LQIGKTGARIGKIWTENINSTFQPGSTSDERTKENIIPLESTIEKIKQISRYRYNFKRDI